MTDATATPSAGPEGDLRILKTMRRAAGSGAWVLGRIRGYRFEALVFPEHAANPAWEIGTSRISKLWVAGRAGCIADFNWDRGLDVAATDPEVQAIVDYLAANLAERVYG